MQLHPHTAHLTLSSVLPPPCPLGWAGLNGLGCYQSCEDPSSVSHTSTTRERESGRAWAGKVGVHRNPTPLIPDSLRAAG